MSFGLSASIKFGAGKQPEKYEPEKKSYNEDYDRKKPYNPPQEAKETEEEKHYREASVVFRKHDADESGQLDFLEWEKAMASIEYHFNDPKEAHDLFVKMDKDKSGKISEREFCEYFAYSRKWGFGFKVTVSASASGSN
eukprot:TRINITY_DN4251_c1_g1_i1.p1 TRINITY_DN4251_c1_g1~~TRINITY_DN4251_c1_g1_i1.p1  ORF type:complete len:139 (-),score=38.02 TRINITY_DN4251_c1_g1_i1:50-466(-)